MFGKRFATLDFFYRTGKAYKGEIVLLSSELPSGDCEFFRLILNFPGLLVNKLCKWFCFELFTLKWSILGIRVSNFRILGNINLGLGLLRLYLVFYWIFKSFLGEGLCEVCSGRESCSSTISNISTRDFVEISDFLVFSFLF